MKYFFEDKEIKLIKNRIKNIKIKTIAYCSFENRFAKSGGLGAVTRKILPYLNEVEKNLTVILMTPFYSNIIDTPEIKSTGHTFEVLFAKRNVKAEILQYEAHYSNTQVGSIIEYYLKVDGYFDAKNQLNDPYIYFEDDVSRNDEAIKDHALLFCKIVPIAMQHLKLQENIVFHLQEWQTALISLTSKTAMLSKTLHSCATVQTMHNPFDSFYSSKDLGKIFEKERIQKAINRFKDGLTAYQIGLQLVDAPITTVSENFAKEITSDILQTKHFVPHLQQIFKRTVVIGINNGLFVDFPQEFAHDENLTLQKIKRNKTKNRKKLLSDLTEYNPPQKFGDLTYNGRPITNLPDAIPIFVMSGRLDFNQKGYDIFLHVIEKFAKDEIKVILTPMPVKRSHLDSLHELVQKCKGNVTVFPMKMERGFHELQIGSSFGIMPSIYEPFGAAIEYMVNGTVNIARKTGGLVDQIEDLKCGFLYRENRAFYKLPNIKEFFEHKDDVQARRKNKWVQSMVDVLHEKMIDAINLYQNHPHEYYRLIYMGFKKARMFDWSIIAKKYYEVYDMVKRGF